MYCSVVELLKTKFDGKRQSLTVKDKLDQRSNWQMQYKQKCEVPLEGDKTLFQRTNLTVPG